VGQTRATCPEGLEENKMTYIMVDVETDGPIPGDFSMISLGAIVVEPELDRTFAARFRPISEQWVPEALAVSGHSREETLVFPPAQEGVGAFGRWVSGFKKPMFISDNNGFDWMFVCWYFHHFYGECPFGFSSTNLGSLYKGLVNNTHQNFKHLRKTRHTHDPLDDARGNAEALLTMRDQMGLQIQLR
jgi:hypothetical protein